MFKLCFFIFIFYFNLTNSLTESYMKYYYKLFHSDVKIISDRLNSSCVNPLPNEFIEWHSKYGTSSIDGELIYMKMRELDRSLNVLEIGSGYGLISAYILQAIVDKKQGSLTAVGKIKNNLFDKGTLRNEYAAKGYFKFIEGEEINILRSLIQKKIIYDIIFIGPDFDIEQHNLLINNFLDPLIKLRGKENSKFLPALQLYFYTNNKETQLKSIENDLDLEQVKKDKEHTYRKHRHHQHSTNKLLRWLHEHKERSIETNILNGMSNILLQNLRYNWNWGIDSENICGYFSAKYENILVYASILEVPRVTIITACSRPHLLNVAKKSIDFNLIDEWIIVYDLTTSIAAYDSKKKIDKFSGNLPLFQNNKKITEIFNTERIGAWGNIERNIALQHISKDRVGWLYYLDDDNIMHSNIWEVFQMNLPTHLIFLGNFRGGLTVFSYVCEIGLVDSGQLIIPIQIAKETYWQPYNYSADGLYITDICNLHSNIIKRLFLSASYHNGQFESYEPDFVKIGYIIENRSFV